MSSTADSAQARALDNGPMGSAADSWEYNQQEVDAQRERQRKEDAASHQRVKGALAQLEEFFS